MFSLRGAGNCWRRNDICSMVCNRGMAKRRIDVILTDSFPKLGDIGELKSVKPGHARNFLFPKKMAVYATDVNRVKFEKYTAKIDVKAREEEAKRKMAVARLENIVVKAKRQVVGSENGAPKLHSPILKEDIQRLLWRQHYIQIATDKMQLDNSKGITKLGEHLIPVQVADNVVAKLRLKLEER